ncbi:type II toxin-antitoxin system RelE/ParE family toxin [Mesorhizobium sp. BH1-1-4]|uniref:type II toxin-antitoxin system RelE/ParE family toxin n=1 Tax=Mesorhizobium sp. BH1-1-4 TaxID=2876662 RepID=UPI0029621849|nr:type II toxin-antitoxin system RelE/ParE family toxin [Mesorhizobium sp. BH1-1-4]
MIQRLAVILSEEAIADLGSIASYIFNQSGSQQVTIKFVDRIELRCQSIGNAPRGGRSRDDIVPGLRTRSKTPPLSHTSSTMISCASSTPSTAAATLKR